MTELSLAGPQAEPVRPSRLWLAYAGLGLLLAVAVLLAFYAGRFPIAAGKVLAIVFGDAFAGAEPVSELERRIVTAVRGPRIVLVCLCGAGLALAGATMQGVFRNPLASPQILGVSAGAAFGGALALLLGFSGFMLIGWAFAMGVAALLAVGLIARVGGSSDNATIILAGIVVGTFFAALVSLTQLLADPQSSLPAIVFWLMGSFAAATWDRVVVAGPVILAGSAMLWAMRFRINVLSLGEEEAGSLGIPVERDRWLIYLTVALVVAATVSVAGIVGWVGLVVPHAARLAVGHDHRALLPASALLGAGYLCLVDSLARSAMAAEIPLGVLTALVGAPVVAVLLRRMQLKGAASP